MLKFKRTVFASWGNPVRLGELFAYEISKELEFEAREVVTSLGIATVPVLKSYPVLAAIMRAGLPFHQGFLNHV